MLFDSHIHLDQFRDGEIERILLSPQLSGVLAVATDLASCERLLALKHRYPKLHIAAGFHPEQPLPSEPEQLALLDWIAKNHANLTACGEVGLPHYLKRENPSLDYQPYINLFEQFIITAKRYDLPLNLHIVYEDTAIALELLNKHQIPKAQFHWFKASPPMLEKLLATPYFISLTPDILTNPKTRQVARQCPLERLLIETDAPWQHQDFEVQDIVGQLSTVIKMLSRLKQISIEQVRQQIIHNVNACYALSDRRSLPL